jgi:cytochrome c biogenesis protein CcmG/thiol:disulfide interchange protein DsbE
MKTKFMALVPLLVIILLALILYVGIKQNSSRIPFKALIGKEVPLLTIRSIINHKKLEENISGKNDYVLHFFTSWCEYCEMEHRKLVRMAKSNNKIPIYGIFGRDSEENIKLMLKKNGNPFNDVANDEHGEISIDLGVNGIPETIIIKDKKIVDRFKGEIDEKALASYWLQ